LTILRVKDAAQAREIAAAEVHIASCPDCRRELESLRPVVDRFVSWPTDVLRPTTSLQARLAHRIAEETGKEPVLPPARSGKQAWSEPEWEQVAPGIECKLFASDTERHRVSMLVRLAPGASYPAHTHAGAEELHLLDGELAKEKRAEIARFLITAADGPKPDQFRADDNVVDFTLSCCEQVQAVSAICLGPCVLVVAAIIKGR